MLAAAREKGMKAGGEVCMVLLSNGFYSYGSLSEL